MKKGKLFIAFATIIIIVAVYSTVSYFLISDFQQKEGIQLSPGDDLHLPSGCDDSEIQATWDSVFHETSAGITILKGDMVVFGICEKFLAYKFDEENTLVSLLMGGSDLEGKDRGFFGKHGNISEEDKINLLSLTNVDQAATVFVDQSVSRESELLIGEAVPFFESVFKHTSESWQTLDEGQSNMRYEYLEEFTNSSVESEITGAIFSNKSFEAILFTQDLIPPEGCTPSWTAVNSSCQPDDVETISYTDANNCDGPLQENQTTSCDYDRNGIIKNFSMSTSNINLRAQLDSDPLNLSEVHNSTKKIELMEGNIARVTFKYDFDEPLDTGIIEVKKQGNSSTYGFLIANNIEATKTFVVDKLKSTSNAVCVRNTFVSSNDSFTSNCTGSYEEIIPCYGSTGSIKCNITNGRFVVSGLTHSGVKEFTEDYTLLDDDTNCTPSNWICGSWSACANSRQTRNCTDAISCDTLQTKTESQTCSPTCSPNWICTDWKPIECPEDETQTRTCQDDRACGTTTGKLPETRECTHEQSGLSTTWIIVIILIILIVAIGLVISFYFLKKSKEQSNSAFQPTTYQQPRAGF